MSINNCVFSGNLTRDPELKKVQGGKGDTYVCNFGIAVNREHKAKGEKKQETAFLNCELWDSGAETFAKYFSKGDPVTIECEVKQENWEKEGEKRSALKFRVSRFHFNQGYDYKKNEDGDDGSNYDGGDDVGFDNGSADDDIPF